MQSLKLRRRRPISKSNVSSDKKRFFVSLKTIRSWAAPNQATWWSFVIAVITLPSGLLTYYQCARRQDTEPAVKALTASMRPEVRPVRVAIESFVSEGECVAVTLENVSSYPARNVRWQVYSETPISVRPFSTHLLNAKNIGVRARGEQKFVVCRLADLTADIRRTRQFNRINGVRRLGEPDAGIVGVGVPFVLRFTFDTDGGETTTSDCPVYIFVE